MRNIILFLATIGFSVTTLAHHNDVQFQNFNFTISATGEILKKDLKTGKGVATANLLDSCLNGQPALYASSTTLLAICDNQAVAFGADLKKIGSIKVETQSLDTNLDALSKRPIPFSHDYMQVGTKLFALNTEKCEGCKIPYIIKQTTIDFSTPEKILVNNHAEEMMREPTYSYKTTDGTGWFFVKEEPHKTFLEWNTFDSLNKAASSYRITADSKVMAMTGTQPYWLVVKAKRKYQLLRAEIVSGKIKPTEFTITELKGDYTDVHIHSDGSKLNIEADGQSVNYDVSSGTPTPL